MKQKKLFEFGGYVAAVVLIAFGIGTVVMGINGRNEVRTDVKREFIVGSPDMNKAAILAEAKQAKLPAAILDQLPTCNVAGKEINSGARAKCFAAYMRIHTFEATRRQDVLADGPLPDQERQGHERLAPQRPRTRRRGQPVENAARNLWVTETALTERAEHVVLRRAGRDVRHRRRDRPPARRDRLRRSSPSWPSAGFPPARPPRRRSRRRRPSSRRRRPPPDPLLRLSTEGRQCRPASVFFRARDPASRVRPPADVGRRALLAHWSRDRNRRGLAGCRGRAGARRRHRGQPPAAPLRDLHAPRS